MKKWISLLFVAVIVLFLNVEWTSASAKQNTSASAPVPKLYLDGKLLEANVPPVLVKSSVLVPIRTVAENLGYKVSYDKKKRQVSVEEGSTAILMTVDKPSASINGNAFTMSAPPILKSNTTMIPLRFVSETFGLKILWEQDSRSVFLSKNKLQGHLQQIRYESDTVVINYDGLAVPTTNVLDGPNRIIIDLPNTDYASDFMADETPSNPALGQIAELAVNGHEALQKIRFSQYQTDPFAARIVLDLNQLWNFEVVNDTAVGEIRIQLKKPQPVRKGFTVVLDAGHGGKDPGAPSVTGKWEKDFNLSIVKKVQALLAKESRINLVLTRESDIYPSLGDRVNMANNLKADVFVSVHGNSFNSGANGTETYYNRSNSRALANLMHKNIVAATQFLDRGVRNQGFKVIKDTTMPAVLLEIGFLSHTQNAQQMFNDAFQKRVAQAIVTSIKQYLKLS
jgi:N-acetylmuramoyl-L-alanine amidase